MADAAAALEPLSLEGELAQLNKLEMALAAALRQAHVIDRDDFSDQCVLALGIVWAGPNFHQESSRGHRLQSGEGCTLGQADMLRYTDVDRARPSESRASMRRSMSSAFGSRIRSLRIVTRKCIPISSNLGLGKPASWQAEAIL